MEAPKGKKAKAKVGSKTTKLAASTSKTGKKLSKQTSAASTSVTASGDSTGCLPLYSPHTESQNSNEFYVYPGGDDQKPLHDDVIILDGVNNIPMSTLAQSPTLPVLVTEPVLGQAYLGQSSVSSAAPQGYFTDAPNVFYQSQVAQQQQQKKPLQPLYLKRSDYLNVSGMTSLQQPTHAMNTSQALSASYTLGAPPQAPLAMSQNLGASQTLKISQAQPLGISQALGASAAMSQATATPRFIHSYLPAAAPKKLMAQSHPAPVMQSSYTATPMAASSYGMHLNPLAYSAPPGPHHLLERGALDMSYTHQPLGKSAYYGGPVTTYRVAPRKTWWQRIFCCFG